MQELTFREKFASILGADAEYLRIHSDSKAPRGSFSRGRRNRLAELPPAGNFGVLPRGRLVILDVDSHGKGSPVREQVAAFSTLLGVDLSLTLTVATPGGGLHYYLLLPEGVTAAGLPKTTLRYAQASIRELSSTAIVVDADIRSAAANAYVVGPDSAILGASYQILRFSKPLVIPASGVKNLLQLSQESQLEKKAKNFVAEAPVDLWAEEPLSLPSPDGLLRTPPPPPMLHKLERALKKKDFSTYHRKRAFVKAALHCCYSNDAIAKACSELSLDLDSATNERLTRYSLQKDVHSFKPSQVFHGLYCERGLELRKRPKREWSDAALEAHLGKLTAKVKAKKQRIPSMPKSGNSRVLDVEKISKTLAARSNRQRLPKQYFHALTVVDSFLQPLCNVGAEKILMARDQLRATTELTDSQVAQALRLLREAGIIEVASRQKTGLAPTYYVAETFTHRKLTRYLRATWAATTLTSGSEELHPAILWKGRRGVFVQALTGEFAHENPLASKFGETDALILEEVEEKSSVELITAFLRFEEDWRRTNPLNPPQTKTRNAGLKRESLIEYKQLTAAEGWTPQNSVSRPGLQLPFLGRGNRAVFHWLVSSGTLGSGGGGGQILPSISPPPDTT